MSKRSFSPSSDRSSPAPQSTASIGLGLQQTGIGITPTASPQLGVASPNPAGAHVASSIVESSVTHDSPIRNEGGEEEEEEDDDLDDFAAELDMSLCRST